MSLTSYRAAPPRVELLGLVLRPQNRPWTDVLVLGAVCYLYPILRPGLDRALLDHWALFDRLEDLAATYSPVP